MLGIMRCFGFIVLSLVAFGTTGLARAACPGATSEAHCLYASGFSPVGGDLVTTTQQLLATNMDPFQRESTAEELKRNYENAASALTTGQAERDALVSLMDDWTEPATCPGTTTAHHLYCEWSLNYETEGKVTLPDTNGDGEPERCALVAPNIAALTSARDTFAYQVAINWAPAGSTVATTRLKLLQAIRAIADSYLIVADEFFVDSTEFRVAIADATNLPSRLNTQRLLATKARLCYQEAIDAFLYGFSPAVGRNLYAADFFGERDTEDGNLFGLFNLAVERWSAAVREEAAKRRASGITPNPADQVQAAAAFRTTLAQNATQTYVLAAASAHRQSTNFTSNGGARLKDALDLMRILGQSGATGLNPLGYDDRFVPMQDFSELLNLAKTKAALASTSYDLFTSHRRNADFDIERLQDILTEDANNLLKAQLATLTGVPLGAADFDTRVAVAGDNFGDCGLDLDNTAFVTCMNGADKASGTLAAKHYDRHHARQQWAYALRHKASILAEIDSENQQYGARLEIEHRNLQGVKDTLNQFLADMAGARTIIKSEDKYKDDGEENGADTDSKGQRTTTSTSYTLRNDSLHLEVKEEIDMQALLADYRIALDGVQHQGTIETLLRQAAEQESVIDMEVQNENAATLDFANLLAQRDDLIFQRARASEHAQWTARRIMGRAAESRILRSREALQFQSDFTRAVRFSYLAAKALEYRNLLRLVNVGNADSLLNLTDLYKMQDIADLIRFNSNLEDYQPCPWDASSGDTVVIDLAINIFGLTDDVIDGYDPGCKSRPTATQRKLCRDDVRKMKVQGELNKYLLPDPDENWWDRSILVIPFSTSLGDRNMTSLYNAKAWYNTTENNCEAKSNGLAVRFKHVQGAEDWEPEIVIEQRGTTMLRRPDETIAEYVPVGTYLNMVGENDDTMYRSRALVVPGRGLFYEAPYRSEMWSRGLKGRSVAAPNWTIEIRDRGYDPIDWSKFEGLEIHIDVIGSTQ